MFGPSHSNGSCDTGQQPRSMSVTQVIVYNIFVATLHALSLRLRWLGSSSRIESLLKFVFWRLAGRRSKYTQPSIHIQKFDCCLLCGQVCGKQAGAFLWAMRCTGTNETCAVIQRLSHSVLRCAPCTVYIKQSLLLSWNH